MLNFAPYIDLPLIWGFLIATAIFLYVLLDGFDLGSGILFLFAPSDFCRRKILGSISPFWDGNETWLVLGTGGLFVAFPPAYSILLSAFYLPATLMLIGLIFRGVAFEFHFKSYGKWDRLLWDISFHAGSVLATFMQGVILGNFIQGVEVFENQFSGGPLDWVNGFSIFTGIALIFGYSLLGSTWIMMKTDGITKSWARRVSFYVLSYLLIFMLIITISMPFIDYRISKLWFSYPNFLYLLPIPFTALICILFLIRSLIRNDDFKPFFFTICIFFFNYVGIGISIYPWIVPFKLNLWQAAAVGTSQSITLIGVAVLLPIILIYTAYVYFVFRGKISDDITY